jgi:polysaccharide biosynthesis transport protein
MSQGPGPNLGPRTGRGNVAEQQLAQDLRRIVGIAQKRRGLLLTSLAVCLVGAFVYNYTTRPVYQATAQILIAESAPDILPGKELVGPLGDYSTEYALLKSRSLAEKLVERLKLDKNRELLEGSIMSPWERFNRVVLRKPPTTDLSQDGIPLSPAGRALRSRLIVEPQAGGRLVNLKVHAYDPGLSAAVANAWAELYIQQSLEFRYTTSNEANTWLTQRVAEQKERVEQAEKALLEYRARQGIQTFSEGEGIVAEKVIALTSALMDARMDRMEKETLVRQARGLPPSRLVSLPPVMASAVVQTLRTSLAELEAQETRLSQTLGPKHPDMVKVRSDVEAGRQKLDAEILSVISSLEAGYQAALAHEQNLNQELEVAKRETLETNRQSLEYSILAREVETSKDLLKTLMSRNKQTDLETELQSSNVRIVERAEVPGRPYLPNKTRNFQMALLLGLALGAGLALLFERLDNTLKTPEDIKEHLGVPFLGMVPDVTAHSSERVPRPSPLIVRDPQSAVAESYRVLRTNLIFSVGKTESGVFVVSSAGPGEGKTTTVANLASSLALNGSRVLAVDADLRRPTMHKHFGLAKAPGFSDLIVGKAQASQVIQETRFKGLQVLPCGYVPPNPAELLGGASIKSILEAFRSHYDWVLIDTPPILGMADTPVLCPNVDGVVLVVGAEVSTRQAIHRALEQVASVGGRVIGAVLNRVDLERNSYYYSQYYGEYYRSYYAEGARQEQRQERDVRPGPRPIRRA